MNMPFDPWSSATLSGRSVLLYGAGSAGRKSLRILRENGFNVPFVLDTNALRVGDIDGTPVRSPSDEAIKAEDRALPVVITIFNRDVDTVSIAHNLKERGFRAVVSFPDFHSSNWKLLGNDFWLGDPAIVDEERQEIARVASSWSDDKSRRTFLSLVDFYRTRNPTVGPHPDPRSEEYMPPDVPEWRSEGSLRFVDGGAFDGDTIQHLRRSGLRIETAACFEPDPENFARLRDRVRGWAAADRRGILLWPCGLAERTEVLNFSAGGGESSHLSEGNAGTPITCVALDDALPGFEPNLIKLDVEGAEQAALYGASNTIQSARPALAISIYHRPSDLWQLPALINGWGLDYRLYLRCYGFNGFDTVCYALSGAHSNPD